ncbi:AraC family transcriptional regulator [Paenibacillus sanguinis]|uniref:AraC family transcriptional regulator n=1 Tax=Paenibacillus sanguinis TaxID=225906 RepID=UPI00037ABE3A|nr:AraC family transcriptional regulator [Paenibacillus sanguinis]
MKYLYKKELIKYTDNLPIKMYVCRIESVPLHWHQEMEILLLVKGKLQINVENNNYVMEKDDLMLINSNHVHSFVGADPQNLAVIIQLDMNMFKGLHPQIEKMEFTCNSMADARAQEKYAILKKLLVDILKAFDTKETGYILEIYIILQQMILNLVRKFEQKLIDEENMEKSNDNLKRLERILHYIDQNCDRKITLDEISKREYLSTYYFSHFFKDKIGMSFQSYLKHIRLKKAYEMLLYTDEKVVDIAMQSGFANSQVFGSSFKAQYGMTPKQCRVESKRGKLELRNSEKEKDHKYVDEDFRQVFDSLQFD